MKALLLPLAVSHSFLTLWAKDSSTDRTKVEFFEKLYDTKIEGVKLLEEYSDPDQFYSAIAKQVGIPEVVHKAVEEKYGWKNDDENFLILMIKGGGDNDAWGVMVTKVPSALKAFKGKV